MAKRRDGAAGLKRLKMKPAHWLSWGFLTLIGIAGVLATTPGSKRFYSCALFLAAVLMCLAFPFARLAEKEELRFASLRSADRNYTGVLIRISKAKNFAVAAGSLLAAILCALHAEGGTATGMKAGLGVIIFGGVFVVFAVTTFRNRPGILLNSEGIVWNQAFEAAVFAPWSSIARAGVFLKKEKYTSAPAFGILLSDESAARTTAGTHSTMRQHAATDGFHLRYEEEDLLYPVEDLERLVTFYLENPRRRDELDTGVALHRFDTPAADPGERRYAGSCD